MAGYAAPWGAHLDAARAFLESLPASIREAARDSRGAQALICALLLDPERPGIRRQQLDGLRAPTGADIAAAVERLAPALKEIPDGFRLAVIDLCRPALRTIPEPEFELLLRNVETLIRADESVSLFEYAVSRLLRRIHEQSFRAAGGGFPRLRSAAGIGMEISCVLSALAYAGQTDAAEAARAFDAAARKAPAGVRLQLLPPERCGLSAVDGALRAVARLEPNVQRWLLEAALVCLAHSGRVEPREGDLFRAIAAALDCPTPLWL